MRKWKLFSDSTAAPRVEWMNAVRIAALLVTVAFVLGALIGLLPNGVRRPDVSGKDTFLVAPEAEEMLASLSREGTVYLLSYGGEKAADEDLLDFLSDFVRASNGKLTLEIVDTRLSPDFAAGYGLTLSNWSVIVETDLRYRAVDCTRMYYYYNALLGRNLYAAEYTAAIEAYQAGDTANALYSTGEILTLAAVYNVPYFDGNALLTAAVYYTQQASIPTLAVYRGEGAYAPDEGFLRRLSLYCYDAVEIASMKEIPEDCPMLILHAPEKDLTAAEAEALGAYLDAGGDLWLNTFYNSQALPNLAALLSAYGLGFGTSGEFVCEGNETYCVSSGSEGGTYPYYFLPRLERSHSLARGFTGTLRLMMPHAITLSSVEGVTTQALFTTTGSGYLATTQAGETEAPRAKQCVAATATKGETQILWFGTPYVTDATANTASSGGNYVFLVSAIERSTGTEAVKISISPRALPTSVAVVNNAGIVVSSVIFVILLPASALIVGAFRRRARKAR